ncbi:hypothetical protein [Streptomyces sp. gb1(2016)]|uniref:hypothetical protein n=1 Tax=Streptomyces sp. gb1(2016) TaxID=1828321 RepID=UPI0011CD799C|nr:hypothetical protein [Streptomyces sp. gb1(2016)]
MSNNSTVRPRYEPEVVRAGSAATAVGYAVAAILLACLGIFGAAFAATAAEGDLVNVFVVPDPAQTADGAVTLQSIAAGTLGTPARAGEILELNRGLAQPDGAVLNGPGDQLRPGWVLRLPPDAVGPEVKQARDRAGTDILAEAPASASPGVAADRQSIPLPAVVAVIATFLLALVTAGIVGRRKVRAGFAVLAGMVRKLGDPARRRRRLMQRRGIGRQFATDADSARRAYEIMGELASAARRPGEAVHALCVNDSGVTVWLEGAETLDAPWSNSGGTRWHRPVAGAGYSGAGAVDHASTVACLVRAGISTDGGPLFVDLSRVDGVLSLTGDGLVARDMVNNLLSELARARPNTPVTILPGTAGAHRISVPSGLHQLSPEAPPVTSAPGADRGTVRAAASRRPVRGLVVVAGVPTERESAELAALCGPGGAGWTGLVCGDVGGAHWRWHAHRDGHVDVPVLDVRVTVPA